MKKRIETLAKDYGPVALVVYFTIFFASWIGFAAALLMGFEVGGATAEGAAVWLAAYGATKVLQPLRIGLTLVATPFVAAVVLRRKRTAPVPEGEHS